MEDRLQKELFNSETMSTAKEKFMQRLNLL